MRSAITDHLSLRRSVRSRIGRSAHDRETLIVLCRQAPWYSGKTDKGEHSSSTARLPGRASSLCPTMRCGMQRGFFGFQFVDQLLSSIDRHPIENLALNPPIAPDVPIDLVTFFAHGICAPMPPVFVCSRLRRAAQRCRLASFLVS